MFETLKNGTDDTALLEPDVVYDLLIENFQCSLEDLYSATTLAATLEQLEVFHSVVQTFGMSRELLAFVDHDQTLSRYIPEIPSLEAYLADTNFDTTIATEAVLDKIKEVARRFAEAFMKHIVKFRSWYKNALSLILSLHLGFLSITGKLIIDYNGAKPTGFSNTELLTALLKHPYTSVPIITNVMLAAALKFAKSTPAAVEKSLQLKLPTTFDERQEYVTKVREIFIEMARVDVNKLDVATITTEEKEKSAAELGYTPEHIKEVITDIHAAIDAIKRGNDIPDRLEALAKSPEAETPNGRAALIFLTSVVTKTMHLAVSNTTKAIGQMNKLDAAVQRAEHEHKE